MELYKLSSLPVMYTVMFVWTPDAEAEAVRTIQGLLPKRNSKSARQAKTGAGEKSPPGLRRDA